MTQPSEGFLLKLTDPFVRETEIAAQLAQRARWNTVQAVAGDDDLSQSVGKLEHQSQQSIVDQCTIEALLQTPL
jgi:hypothetical protein